MPELNLDIARMELTISIVEGVSQATKSENLRTYLQARKEYFTLYISRIKQSEIRVFPRVVFVSAYNLINATVDFYSRTLDAEAKASQYLFLCMLSDLRDELDHAANAQD